MKDNIFHISSSPHFNLGVSTQKIMLCVIISLLPECIYGIYLFGLNALIVILTSVISCVLFEFIFQKITKQKVVINNLSAVVTGLMLALVCPPSLEWWMVVIGSAVAIIIAKGLFGGIGSNIFNPALIGRAVLFISFPSVMGAKWLMPFNSSSQLDAISSATVLSKIKSGSQTSIDLFQYFFGNHAGCIGETSILLILLSFIFLLIFKIIDWRAPLGMILSVSVFAFFNGLIKENSVNLALNNILIMLFTGGIMFGAVFMITDYATTPVTKPGRFIFGLGCGIITSLIRIFGSYPEGVMFSILIMNSFTPFLNNLTVRKYGYGKKGNLKPDCNKINKEFDLKMKDPSLGGK